MRKEIKFLAVLLFLIFLLLGCSQKDIQLKGDKPPQPTVYFEETDIPVYQSSYCWVNGCTDYASPEDTLMDKAKTIVSPNKVLKIKFEYFPQPSNLVLQLIEGHKATDIEMVNHSFLVPEKEGIYFYKLSANWISSIDERVVLGDSNYVFAIEVAY
ncbi:hypothetical protein [Chengkuizengella marina]|uniref:Lipoprotein n=1 Tax=Chengkuizengella marina TaxID=2507566 RepID=A0A6N9Q0G7_9BACL|nr:hypothetical protein [Chengkuizengella marina]NBI28203.1 hypothetical protein [Chengkuizengella marina]